MKEKNFLKKKSVIAGAVIVAVCIAVFALLAGGGSSARRIAELLDLGNKYLTEQDYEQAVVTFQEAIEIDPKCEEAYRGLADVYVAMGDYESAMDILQQGIAQTGSEELTAYLEEIRETYTKLQEEAAAREREEAEAAAAAERAREQEELIGRVAIREIYHRVVGWEENPGDDLAIVIEMDAKGNSINVAWYYDYQRGLIWTADEYVDGKLMKYTQYNLDGTVAWKGGNECEYEYDADGNIVTASYYDEDGYPTSIDEYDSDGRIVKTWELEETDESDEPLDSYAVYEYDADGNVIKITYMDSEGEVYAETVKEYDSKGRIVKHSAHEDTYVWECENEAGEIQTVYLCEYERIDGNLVRETFYGESGEVIKENLY